MECYTQDIREKYKDLFEHSLDLIYVCDMEGKILDVNDTMLKTFGINRDYLMSLSLKDLVDVDQIEKILKNLREIKETGTQSSLIELSFRKGKKEKIYLETYGIPIRQNGVVCGILCIGRNITQFKEIEENLRNSKEEYQLITDNVNDLIAIIDNNITFEFVNENSLFRILGYKTEEILRKSVVNYVHKDDKLEFIRGINNAITTGETNIVVRFIHKNNKYIWMEAKGKLIIDDIGRPKAFIIARDITEKKESERRLIKSEKKLKILNEELEQRIEYRTIELKESEKLYRNIIENVKDAIVTVGFDGNFIFVSPQLSEMLGGIEIKSLTEISKVIHPDDINRLFDLFQKGIKEKNIITGIDIEFRVRHKDGHDIRVASSSKNYYDDEGNVIGFISLIKDISEKKIAEQKLKESEEKYRLISENAYDLIVLINQKLRIEYINEAPLQKISGFTSNELIGKSIVKYMHPDDIAATLEVLREGLKTGVGSVELRLRHKDGPFYWIDVKGTTFKDENGEIKGILIGRDITERKETEEKMKISEQKYRHILNNLNDLIFIINKQLKFEFINEPIFKKLLGYTKEDTIKSLPINSIHPDDVHKVIQTIKNSFKSLEGSVELRIRDKNKKYHWHELKGKLFIDVDGQEKTLIISRDISSEKKAEEKLKESEKKYRLIAENVNDFIGVINQNFVFEYINEEIYQRELGYTEEDFVGQPALKFVYPEDLKKAASTLKEGFKTGEGNVDIRFRHSDGHYIWLQIRGRTFIDTDGELKAIIVARDISDKKRVEKNLKKSEERFRHLFERSPYGILLIDVDGKIFDCNLPSERIFDRKRSELIGINFSEFGIKSLDELPLFTTSFDDILDGRSPEPLELQIFKSDKKKTWISLQESLVTMGNDMFIQIIIQDITEKKRSDKKIKESEEKYRTLIELSPNSIVLLDFEGNVTECNEVTEIFTGLSRNEIIGSYILDLFPVKEERKHRATKAFKKVIAGETYPVELEFENKQGFNLCLVSYFSIVTIGDEKMIQVVSQDITPRKDAEKLIKQEFEKLKELDEIKNEFVYRASHELKTPLNSINVAAAILLKYYEGKTDKKTTKLLNIINRGGQRLKNLVKYLVDIAQIETRDLKISKKQENISKIIKEIADEMLYLAKERDLSLNVFIEGKHYLDIDKIRFEQAILNLISNAIKNTPAKGTISVNLEKYPTFIDVKVSDTGVGITSEEQERIFSKFGKIERHGKGMDIDIDGSGLGLYITKEIVELHGGKIWFESQGRNQGSTFIIRFPVSREI